MTTIYHKSPITLQKLREIIFNNPDTIKQDFKILDSDLDIEDDQIDLLGIDKFGAVVIIKIDNTADSDSFISAINQIFWLKKSSELINRLYLDKKIHFGLKPQLIMISSSFSKKLIMAAQQFQNIEIQYIEFTYLQNKTHDAIIFETIFQNKDQSIQMNIKGDESTREHISSQKLVSSVQKSQTIKSNNSRQSDIISLTPEEIAEFDNFDEELKKSRNFEH
jgi:hypothetical protein